MVYSAGERDQRLPGLLGHSQDLCPWACRLDGATVNLRGLQEGFLVEGTLLVEARQGATCNAIDDAMAAFSGGAR